MRGAGFAIVSPHERTDCCIINTCTVTSSSDYQSRQLMRRAIRDNPGAVVVVTGCYAQVAPRQIAGIPGVTVVAGNTEKGRIVDLLRDAEAGRQQILVEDISRAGICSSSPASLPGRSRAFLKIQDGCDSFCSYCIVPHARGRSRSLPVAAVKEGIAALGRAGYREIVLTGIHLGVYGYDLRPKAGLADIIAWVEDNRPVERLRLSSLEPNEITERLIILMRDSEVLCRHFHIPLQSADDRILREMGRSYRSASLRSILEHIRGTLPDAAVGLDVMVGFPGEGREEFENTLRFLEDAPAAYFHVFSYSRRPGTEASLLSGQITEEEKKRRSLIVRDLGRRKREAFAARFVGGDLSVLIEGGGDETPFCKGVSGNYIPVRIARGEQSPGGGIMTIRAERAEGGIITGRAIADDR